MLKSRMTLFCLLFSTFWAVPNCAKAAKAPRSRTGSDSTKNVTVAPKEQATQRTVLVMDEGFDLTHPVFKDKVVGAFNIKCVVRGEDLAVKKISDLSMQQIKERLIANTKDQNECAIEKLPAIDLQAAGFKAIDPYREIWNKGILSKSGVSTTSAGLSEAAYKLTKETLQKNSGSFHGTSTAGLIAYQNPAVNLLIVQIDLNDAGNAGVECKTQAEIDKYVEAVRDPAVHKALVERPSSQVERQLMSLAKQHKVSLINQSFGGNTRRTLENIYKEKGCGLVNLSEFFRIEAEINEARTRWLAKTEPNRPEVLVIHAAGNEGQKIDSAIDFADCDPNNEEVLMVGSHDAKFKRSTFSNFGKCLNLFGLGEDVVVPAPNNFVKISNGTSYSAPNVTRYLSMHFDPNMSLKDLRRAILSEADANGFLPATAFPAEIAYVRDSSPPIQQYNLIDTSPQVLSDKFPVKTDAQLMKEYRISRALRGW